MSLTLQTGNEIPELLILIMSSGIFLYYLDLKLIQNARAYLAKAEPI